MRPDEPAPGAPGDRRALRGSRPGRNLRHRRPAHDTPKAAEARPASGGGLWRTVVTPTSVRARLVRILALAVALVLVLLGVIAAREISGYNNASDAARKVRLEITLQGFVHELQKERGLTTGFVAGQEDFQAGMLAQRTNTDAALATVKKMVDGRTDDASTTIRNGLVLVDGLQAVRDAADAGRGNVQDTFDWFTNTNTALTGLDIGLDVVQDETLRYGTQALLALSDAKESTGQERALLTGSLPGGKFFGDGYTRFAGARGERIAGANEFYRTATPKERSEYDAVMNTPSAEQVLSWEGVVLGGGGSLSQQVIPNGKWYDTITTFINSLRGLQVSVGQDLQDRASTLEDQATTRLALFTLSALAAIALLIALAVGCARSIARPLSALTREAGAAARERLPQAVARAQMPDADAAAAMPDPVRVPRGSGSEVHDVAEAVDQLQRAAYALATEQAVLRRNTTQSLVSLGRRNQNLVRRQIGFINRLEHEDADPATLANLFELDHLATRMRRNAESLLVLAGESSPRPWATPLGVTDVIRAALSEVEDYRRVTLRRVDPVLISGAVVAELAHLFAELIENALSFSPPDSDVEIEGRRTSAGYLVAVVDHGVGMTPEAIAEANVRLSGTASFMAEPTRFLGHFVVGALAQRHGIEVRLGEAPAAGVVARVLVPNALLSEGDRSDGHIPVPGGSGGSGMPAPDPVAAATQPPALTPPTRSALPAAALPAQSTGRATTPPETENGLGGGSSTRTRNGLVKRPRRSAIPSAVDEIGTRWTAGDTETPERSPEDVASMLSSLRSAHRRGRLDDHQGQPGPTENGDRS